MCVCVCLLVALYNFCWSRLEGFRTQLLEASTVNICVVGCVRVLYIEKDPPQSLHDPYVTPGLLKTYAARKSTH